MHAVLCGAGHNLRLLLNRLRAFMRLLYDWIASRLLFSFGMPAEVYALRVLRRAKTDSSGPTL